MNPSFMILAMPWKLGDQAIVSDFGGFRFRFIPHLAGEGVPHASSAIADVKQDRATFWPGTQMPHEARRVMAKGLSGIN
jgi:hypothetical protein